jgi:signal transduction histidine kinase
MRLADQIRTTTFLLTLRYMVLFFVSVTILVGFINWSTVGYLEQEADQIVETEAAGLQNQFQQNGLDGLVQIIGERVRINPQGDSVYLLTNAELNPLIGNMPQWPQLTPIEEGWVSFDYTDASGEKILARGRVFLPHPSLRLLVGRPVRALDQLTRLFDRTLFWGLGITLILALIGGLLMSENVLRRVNIINSTSRKIMEGDLSQRVTTRDSGDAGDEFDELARNLNAMMDQIESLMSSIEHISDNIAHDLRTPLTRLRNRLEELHRNAGSAEAEEIAICMEDADGLLATFASLLSIARIESGTYEANLDSVDLGQTVRDACELYQALAEEKSINLSCDAPGTNRIRGDRNLIFQALINLLDNAIKYTPVGGTVSASLRRQADSAVLTVSDTGPGIPADMREKVLQRFFRLDKSRSKPGAGLGLSLVQAIVARHKAHLELDDNEPGLRVTIRFPATQPSE